MKERRPHNRPTDYLVLQHLGGDPPRFLLASLRCAPAVSPPTQLPLLLASLPSPPRSLPSFHSSPVPPLWYRAAVAAGGRRRPADPKGGPFDFNDRARKRPGGS